MTCNTTATLSSHTLAPHPRTARRSARVARAALAALAIGSGAALAVPAAASAAPVPATSGAQPQGRVFDPVAEQAARGLVLWREFQATSDASRFIAYAAQRDAVASAVASRLGVDARAMRAAWAAADTPHQQAVLGALSQLGVSYRRNTSKAGEGFDCSGLTTYAWAQAGVTLIRQSASQIRAAAPRTWETAQAGDLVYYPGHVSMYLGVENLIVHSPYTGRNVEVDRAPKRSVKLGDPTG